MKPSQHPCEEKILRKEKYFTLGMGGKGGNVIAHLARGEHHELTQCRGWQGLFEQKWIFTLIAEIT